MATEMKIRRGTESQWASSGFVLAPGQLGYATDSHTLKVGDGFSTWAGLPDIHITDPDINYYSVIKPSATPRISTITLTDDPGLQVPIQMGHAYIFEVILFFTGPASNNAKIGIDAPANSSVTLANFTDATSFGTSSIAQPPLVGNVFIPTTGSSNKVFTLIKGVVDATAALNPGNLCVAFAQSAVSTTPTVLLADSFMEVRRVS